MLECSVKGTIEDGREDPFSLLEDSFIQYCKNRQFKIDSSSPLQPETSSITHLQLSKFDLVDCYNSHHIRHSTV